MTEPPRYIVMKVNTDGRMQTIGPMAEPLHSEAAAETELRRLSLARHGTTFVILEVIADFVPESMLVRKTARTDRNVTSIERRR